MFGSARTAAGGLFSTAGSEHAHLYGSTLLAPGGRRGCTSGCWRPDVTLPVDVRDHRLGPGALCRHDPGTADRHHADRLWLDQPGDSGGYVPPPLDQLLLDGAQGQVRLEGHGPCLMSDRDAGVPIRALRGDDTLIPSVSAAAPGAAIQYDHAHKPNRPDYLLAQTVVSLSAVIGNSWGSWSVPLMSNLARQPRQARNDAGPGGGGEREPGRDHPAARCLVHERVPDR